ncbi:MAG: DUF4199 domain-containing protein [Bacteroidales bacterium]|nr:DUF4199 domain-containing protein [Bacteroidales bacterium]
MEKKTSLVSHSLIWGAILGIVGILLSLIFWFLNILPSNFLIILLLLVINLTVTIVFVVIGTKKYRDDILEGKINFGRAFLVAFLIIIISSIITGLWGVTLSKVIDPKYTERTIESTKQWTSEMLIKRGVPEDKVEESLAQMDEKSNPSVIQLIKGALLKSSIFGVIISLIVAAILKRDEIKLV